MDVLQVESRQGDYNVIAEPGSVARLGEILEAQRTPTPRSVVSNTTVAPLWAKTAAASIDAPLMELADGEEHKRWPTVEGLLSSWLETGLHRKDSVAAVGGGVLTDTVGFGGFLLTAKLVLGL